MTTTSQEHPSRRRFLALGAGVVGLAAHSPASLAQVLPTGPSELGSPRREYGERSPFETSKRNFNLGSATPGTGGSKTPLQDTFGIITPSALHFERHHAGVPTIDPARHELLLHGLVERPLVFSLEDLKRLPSVSRIYFIECAGNSGREHYGRPGETPEQSHGYMSCSEWTGVPLRHLLAEAGLRPGAEWVVAEGVDACRMARSIPIEKALADVLVAYGQNGEALRPEQGYPVRLVVPGWEGNINIKWLGRLHVTDQPAMTREEAASYTDLMPDSKAWRFSFVMDAKSVILRPAGGQSLPDVGWYQVEGLAWSGRGRVARVDVSTDDGKTWQTGRLQEPVLSKAFTRFGIRWHWNGRPTIIQSRCTDETGNVQPARSELVAARGQRYGPDGFNHYNGIKSWRIEKDGKVTHV